MSRQKLPASPVKSDGIWAICFLAIVCMLLVSSCGEDGDGGDSSGSSGSTLRVMSISLSPSNSKMLAGGTCEMSATGVWSDGITRNISLEPDLKWNSSNSAVATMWGGQVKASGAGVTTISASMDGATANATVTVEAVTNKVILYIATSSDTTKFFSAYNTTVESNAQTMIRYVPDAGLADVIDQNTSYSYASSRILPYTVDNRFFIMREVRPMEYGGSHDFVEYDPKSNRKTLNFGVSDPSNGAAEGWSAILGATYYYKESHTWDMLAGYRGGGFKKLAIDNNKTSEGTILLAYGDPDNLKGNLQASKGVLYDAYYKYVPSPGITYLEIYKRNLTTGKIDNTATKSWTVTDAAEYDPTVHFTFDNNIAYWARMKLSNKQVEIWKHDFSSAPPSQIFSSVVSGIDHIYFFDASNGHLAIGDAYGYVLLYDTSTGKSSTINIGLAYYGLQVLYLPE